MTRIDTLESGITKLTAKLGIAKKEYFTFTEELREGYTSIAKTYFGGGIPLEDVTIEAGRDGSTIYFKRPQQGYSYLKEIFEIRFKEDWRTGEFTEMNTSVYSTSDNSDWNLERLILVGDMCQVVLDYRDDVLGEYNMYRSKAAPKKKDLQRAVRDIEMNIESFQKQIEDFKRDDALKLLEGDGLKFNDTKLTLEVKYNRTVQGVTSAKILSKTKSGLSAAIELTRQYYNGETSREVYENVRMTNIDYLLSQYIKNN